MADPFPWRTCGREHFDRTVELLIQRMHMTEGPGTAEAVDGRGGDGGVDIDVTLSDGTLDTIYQLKYFPEGFSGGWAKSRRPQIKHSFEAAMALSPRRWVLVIPGLATTRERRWVRALGGHRKVEVTTIGRDKLDEMLARWPDIFRYLTFDAGLEALKVGGLGQQAMATPADLAEVATNFADRIDSLSPYWGSRVTTGPFGELTQTLVAKRPDAADKEPIRMVTEFHDNPDGRKARSELREYLDSGGCGVTIPADAVKSVRFIGPPWIAQNAGSGRITLGPSGISSDRRAELRIVSSAEATLQALRGTSRMVRGRREQHLELELDCGIRARFRLTEAPEHVDARLEMRRTSEQLAVEVADAVRFAEILATHGDVRLKLLIEGRLLFSFMNPSPSIGDWFDGYTKQLVDDLVVLGRHFYIQFSLPTTLTRAQRQEIRKCRLVVEGHVVEHSEFAKLAVTLGEKADDSLLEAIAPESVMVVMDTELQYLILGHALPVRAKVFHPRVRVDISSEARAALRARQAGGLQATATPVDASPFCVFLAHDPRRNPDEALVPTELAIVMPDE